MLADPFTWVLVALIGIVSIVVGLRRREPLWAIALNVMGASVLLLGIGYAIRLGDEAFLAVALVTGGLALMAEVNAPT
jgi:membrane-bound ClpP family serine protease